QRFERPDAFAAERTVAIVADKTAETQQSIQHLPVMTLRYEYHKLYQLIGPGQLSKGFAAVDGRAQTPFGDGNHPSGATLGILSRQSLAFGIADIAVDKFIVRIFLNRF
ncbi:MAG: hypothetical protein UT03_C0010G0001, partial [Candidatus Moranbacteria bacterium GW2011_GWD2_38_7]